ncbi:MAG: MGMT family protein [Actinomycetes bacterium]
MPHDALPTPFAEQVLDLVAQIPPGRVMAYSDVAQALKRGGARQVGQALARFGSGVPWWRVLRSDGRCAPVHADEQGERLRKEGTAFAGDRVDMSKARWTPRQSHRHRGNVGGQ